MSYVNFDSFKRGVLYSAVAVSSAACFVEAFHSRYCLISPVPHCRGGLEANAVFLGGLPGLCLASAAAAFCCFQNVFRQPRNG